MYLWLGFFSFLLLTVFSSSSQSHILTYSANHNPTHQNPYMQLHVLIPGSAHCWTLLPSTEPPWFMPAEAMVPSVITPTLHSCPTRVYPIIQTTDAPAWMHTHIPTSGNHKLIVITPWTSFIFTKLTNTSSIHTLKRCIIFSTSLKEVCALNLAFSHTHRNTTKHLRLLLKHTFSPFWITGHEWLLT